jgi:hypothetical protein
MERTLRATRSVSRYASWLPVRPSGAPATRPSQRVRSSRSFLFFLIHGVRLIDASGQGSPGPVDLAVLPLFFTIAVVFIM